MWSQETSSTEISWDECARILESLPSMAKADRQQAVIRLLGYSSYRLRRRAVAIGSVVMEDCQIEALIRNHVDDVQRNAGLEMLKLRGRKGLALIQRMLVDDDPHVVIQGVLALAPLSDPRAASLLRQAVTHEDANVAQAAVEIIGSRGENGTAQYLIPLLSADRWLQLAVIQALGQLRCSEALAALRPLLDDGFVGEVAIEATARIGGENAFTILAQLWMEQGESSVHPALEGLCQVVKGLSAPPARPAGLRDAMLSCLLKEKESPLAFAHLVLALGPGEGDEQALAVLVTAEASSELPWSLRWRADLVTQLLARSHQAVSWALTLAAQNDIPISSTILAALLEEEPGLVPVEAAISLLAAQSCQELAGPLLAYWQSQPAAQRHAITRALVATYAPWLPELLEGSGVAEEERTVLLAQCGIPADEIVAQLSALTEEKRVSAVSQLLHRSDIVARLPWREWVGDNPSRWYPIVSIILSEQSSGELLSVIRCMLRESPHIALIRLVADIGDRQSVPLLLNHLPGCAPLTRALILDALGCIGGEAARKELHKYALLAEPDDARVAIRALAHCATEADLDFFLSQTSSSDWTARLACAEALARFNLKEHTAVLLSLAADPMSVVAECAAAALGI